MGESMIPNRIYFTGAPGSKWSGIAQTLESHEAFNTTDRTEERSYSHHMYSGHVGAYFGEGMEFETLTEVDQAYEDPDAGIMVVKSHDIALDLLGTKIYCCDKPANNWMMLVYRPNDICIEWWQQAGGFDIKYPNYNHYEDNARMAYMIRKMNENMLQFAYNNKLTWNQFTTDWIDTHFNIEVRDIPEFKDVLVTVYKP